MRIESKTRLLLLLGTILFPLLSLILLQTYPIETVNNFTVAFLVAAVILFVPFSNLFCHVLAGRNLRELNEQCRKLQQGDFSLEELPPDENSANEFLKLRRSLHWMGYALASREKRLAGALDQLSDTQRKLMDSIDYARLIQSSFLPDRAELRSLFQDSFLLWEQRDRVGGDSYWFRRTEGKGAFVAVIDCTGHGVPGAFMTLIVHSLFEKAFAAGDTDSPGEILGRMNRLIKDALHQNSPDAVSDDGMDCGLCHIRPESRELLFAGARIPLLLTDDEKIEELRGDRCGLGYVRSPKDFHFTDHHIELNGKMRFYLATDGYTDQVGGEQGFPFGRQRFRDLIKDSVNMPLGEQERLFRETIETYRGEEPRRDDMTVLGFEINGVEND